MRAVCLPVGELALPESPGIGRPLVDRGPPPSCPNRSPARSRAVGGAVLTLVGRRVNGCFLRLGKGPAVCAGADKATYGEAIVVMSFNDLSGGGASLREERFGLRFKFRGGDDLGDSIAALSAWRDETLGGVGGRESLFFLPAV